MPASRASRTMSPAERGPSASAADSHSRASVRSEREWASEVALGRGQDTALRIFGIRGEEETGAGGADDADAAATAVEGIGARRLVEMADGDDRDASALGEAFEGMERPAHSLIGVGVVTTREKGDQGIDDQERSLGAGDDLLEEMDVIRDGSERPRPGV